jgi:hypothetical protein
VPRLRLRYLPPSPSWLPPPSSRATVPRGRWLTLAASLFSGASPNPPFEPTATGGALNQSMTVREGPRTRSRLVWSALCAFCAFFYDRVTSFTVWSVRKVDSSVRRLAPITEANIPCFYGAFADQRTKTLEILLLNSSFKSDRANPLIYQYLTTDVRTDHLPISVNHRFQSSVEEDR